MAIRVTLREKKISKGRKSLYLDFYPAIPHPETGEPTRNVLFSISNKIKAALKQAYKDGILQTDINSKVHSIKSVETRREYLTLTD